MDVVLLLAGVGVVLLAAVAQAIRLGVVRGDWAPMLPISIVVLLVTIALVIAIGAASGGGE